MMKKLLIICGPTATGKTDLAIRLAKKFSAKGGPASGWNGEVISADSRQVYQNMDIGTGKFLDKSKVKSQKSKLQVKNRRLEIGFYLIDGVKIWLYDIVEPDYRFNVADYKECADLVIGDILKRRKLPILVGGTGLYIKAVVDGIETIGVAPDWELRKRLLHCSIVELFNYLKKLAPERAEQMNESDRNNPRRLVRAIEIARKFSNSNFQIINKVQTSKFNTRNILLIGLTAPYKTLYQKIDQRVDERVENGVEKEIRDLLKRGYTFENSALGTTIGYWEWQGLEAGSWKLEAGKRVIQQWKFNEHAYARRQLTWFKKDKRINWLNVDEDNWNIKVEKLVEKWLGI